MELFLADSADLELSFFQEPSFSAEPCPSLTTKLGTACICRRTRETSYIDSMILVLLFGLSFQIKYSIVEHSEMGTVSLVVCPKRLYKNLRVTQLSSRVAFQIAHVI